MMPPQRLLNHYHLLSQVLAYNVPGSVVELGTWAGISAQMLAAVMESFRSTRTLHLYDSFQGLPEPSEKDKGGETNQYLQKGEFLVSEEQLKRNLEPFAVRYKIHPGWFKDTLPFELPETIAYAHLDGDLYDSVMECLAAVYPRVSEGGVIVIDDYDHALWPGAKRAVDDFLAYKPETINSLYVANNFELSTQAYLRKGSR
jgi:O-methyltransferase